MKRCPWLKPCPRHANVPQCLRAYKRGQLADGVALFHSGRLRRRIFRRCGLKCIHANSVWVGVILLEHLVERCGEAMATQIRNSNRALAPI